MSSHRKYTPESVERALEHHLLAGRIASWSKFNREWLVTVNAEPSETYTFKTLAEVHALVIGLGSAARAPRERE